MAGKKEHEPSGGYARNRTGTEKRRCHKASIHTVQAVPRPVPKVGGVIQPTSGIEPDLPEIIQHSARGICRHKLKRHLEQAPFSDSIIV